MPIGLIEDCLGGTPAESWMSPESLHTLKDFDAPLAEIERLHASGGPEYGSFLMHWLDEYDIGLTDNNWAAADLDDPIGRLCTGIPGGFAELGVADVPGVCWFRKELTLPDPLPAGKAMLHLGSIEKMDTAYINGHWVGASSWVENPRAYVINDGVLQARQECDRRAGFQDETGGRISESKPDELRLTWATKPTFRLPANGKAS